MLGRNRFSPSVSSSRSSVFLLNRDGDTSRCLCPPVAAPSSCLPCSMLTYSSSRHIYRQTVQMCFKRKIRRCRSDEHVFRCHMLAASIQVNFHIMPKDRSNSKYLPRPVLYGARRSVTNRGSNLFIPANSSSQNTPTPRSRTSLISYPQIAVYNSNSQIFDHHLTT
jgi:hypothetical protein